MTSPPPEFPRPFALDRLGAAPFEIEVTATAEECAALALRRVILAQEAHLSAQSLEALARGTADFLSAEEASR